MSISIVKIGDSISITIECSKCGNAIKMDSDKFQIKSVVCVKCGSVIQ